MKEILSIVPLLFFSMFAKAQQKRFQLPLTGGTSVLKIPYPKLTWIGKHAHFDIYQATPDNMYVIKPDSTNHFNMPIAGKYRSIKAPIKPPEKNH
jgi:hypothetical protein